MSGKTKKHIPTVPVISKPFKTTGKRAIATGIPGWAIIAVLILTALLYSKALDNGITYMDDDYYILKNQYLRDFSFSGIKAIFTHFYSYNYHPFTTLTFLFEYTLFKVNPLLYHLVNVALHLLNTWLVYKVTEQLSGKRTTALVVAILFAVHPMHVESVAWISERKDVLYTAFYLSSLLFYLRYIESGFRAQHYVVALLLFLASLFSKSAAVTLPVLLILVDVYKGRGVNARSILEKIPFLLLSVLFGILAVMSQSFLGAINDLTVDYGFINRIFLFTAGLASYIFRSVIPANLSGIHYFPLLHNGALPWYYYLSLPFLLVVTWLVARRNAYRKEVLFGTLFFLVTISVMLQIVTVGSAIISERYTYVPYIGLFYIAGQWLSGIGNKKWAYNAIGVFGLFVLACSAQTWNRIGVWKNSDVLFTDITQNDPDNWHNCYVYYYWGLSKSSEGHTQEAIDEFSKAIRLNPGYERAYYYRGLTYDQLHDTRSALPDLNKAILLDSTHADAYNGRGWVYYEMGDKKSAMLDINKSIKLDPEYAEAYNNRGWAYYEAGDTTAAIRDYNKAISVNPLFDKPYLNKAVIEANNGHFKQAMEDYSSLLKVHPDNNLAYYNRGLIRLNLKDNDDACADFKKAADLGNTNAEAAVQQYCH